MKTRKIIIGLTIILILLLVGFLTEFLKAQENNKISKEAADFNNQIVTSQSYISDKIERLDDLFNEVSTKKEAIELLDITSNEVTLEIEKVEGLNSPQQSDEFKQSVLSLYTNYLDILENKYRNQIIPLFFEEINNITIEEFSARNDLIFSEINSDISRLTKNFIEEQEQFAEEFNLELTN